MENTLCGIIRRAYDICSTNEGRITELNFIYKVFTEINGYPDSVVKSMFTKIKEQYKSITDMPTQQSIELENDSEENVDPPIILKVPFRGEKGESVLKNLKRTLQKTLPDKLQCRIVHTGSKLSKNFSLKDKVNKKHLSNFIYKHNCKNKKCKHNYVGETARRKVKRVEEHAGKDKKSHIFQHSRSTKHPRAKYENFEILATNYPNRRKRKLAEAMYIRDLKPTLNKQKESYKLALFV